MARKLSISKPGEESFKTWSNITDGFQPSHKSEKVETEVRKC